MDGCFSRLGNLGSAGFIVSSLKLGFIGAGRMATALARGCVASGLAEDAGVIASDPSESARQAFEEAVAGAKTTDNNAEVLSEGATIVLAVKPQKMDEALATLRQAVEPRHLLVSIAAGVTLDRLAAGLPAGTRLIRVMPNTPCLVGMGASAFARGKSATEEDARLVAQLLGAVGEVDEVDEHLLDAVTGLSGSGPAFVYTAIEALAAGGVRAGLPAELALKLAVQTTRGAAEMIRQTAQTPETLRDQVTSPGGTTVAGLRSLASGGFSETLGGAVEAATQRSKELGAGEA